MSESKSVRFNLTSRAYELRTQPLGARQVRAHVANTGRSLRWYERALRDVGRWWLALRVEVLGGTTRRLGAADQVGGGARTPRTMRMWLELVANKRALEAERAAERAERERQEAERQRRRVHELNDAQVLEEYRRASQVD